MTMPDLTATSLVLEGGGFRGIYTSGVLDYFMEQGLYLPQVYGISAGALNALGYAAKQPGRTAQINFRFCHDKRYISVHNMIKYRCAFNLEFIFDTIPERYIPFDYSTFFSSPVQIHVGATNLLTGRCDFFGKDQMDKKLFPARASAALPLFSYIFYLNGVPYLDGGIACPIPIARSVRDGEARTVTFAQGLEQSDRWESGVQEKNGTFISFRVDREVFGDYSYNLEYVEQMIRNYTYLNLGLTFRFNGQSYVSKNGLLDLLGENMTEEPLYAPIHLSGEDIEVAIAHGTGYGESYYSFVNGQYTSQGGTHQAAFREAIAKTIKEFYHKDYDPSDIRTSIIAAISVRVTDPVFESQTKIKLGSKEIEPGVSLRNFIVDFLAKHLDDYLHKHSETAQILQKKIVENEKERKAISGIQKKARETAKKVSLNNKKLRDCKIHLTDKNELAEESMIFITEGNSASGSITKSRDVRTQAVFSLRGKPLNCFGLTKKVVYENEEFNLLQAALNIEEDMDNLRYNKVVIATDADVDGMHIRLLLMTFFLQFFPDVIRGGHLYVLQTPLFRVRNKKETHYCYSEEEKNRAVARCGANAEITRFKGLGEISPDEFRGFIGQDIRLDKVRLTKDDPIHDMLEFYMGKNTYERQGFIIGNLRIEEDIVESDLAIG